MSGTREPTTWLTPPVAPGPIWHTDGEDLPNSQAARPTAHSKPNILEPRRAGERKDYDLFLHGGWFYCCHHRRLLWLDKKEVLGVMSPELKVESMKFTNLDLAKPWKNRA